MAELQASYIQASSHPADTDRLVLEGLMNPAGAPISGAAYGVGRAANDLKVQAAGTPNMTVDILSGHAWIDGTEGANQGTYHVYNDATKNLVISAAHATLARKDLVVAKVQDAAYSGAVNAWSLAVVTGTPAGSPAEPTVPANAIVLALVDIAAAAASITNGNITDRRRRASALGGIGVCTSSTRPATPYEGQVIYETDTDKVLVYNGSAWIQVGLSFSSPGCQGTKSGSTSVNNATLTTVPFDGENYDTDAMHDTVTNNSRLTFKTAGIYVVTGYVTWQLSAGGTYRQVRIQKNATTDVAIQTASAGTMSASTAYEATIAYTLKAAVNDFVEMKVQQDSGGALTVSNLCTFSATYMGSGV